MSFPVIDPDVVEFQKNMAIGMREFEKKIAALPNSYVIEHDDGTFTSDLRKVFGQQLLGMMK